MSPRTLTGSLLIVGPILMILAYIILNTSLANLDWADAQGVIGEFGANSGLVKTLLSIATLGMLMGAAGLAGLYQSMSGGSGAHYVGLGMLFYVIGTAAALGESTLLIGTAEAGSANQQAIAATLYDASQALGAGAVATFMLGLALIGVGIFAQKPTSNSCYSDSVSWNHWDRGATC